MTSAQLFGQLMDCPLMTDVNRPDISDTLTSLTQEANYGGPGAHSSWSGITLSLKFTSHRLTFGNISLWEWNWFVWSGQSMAKLFSYLSENESMLSDPWRWPLCTEGGDSAGIVTIRIRTNVTIRHTGWSPGNSFIQSILRISTGCPKKGYFTHCPQTSNRSFFVDTL